MSKHWKAYLKVPIDNESCRQWIQVVTAPTEYDARNLFQQQWGAQCVIGWIRPTKLWGLDSLTL